MRREVEFRAARKDDCRTIAKLYRVSSDGVADYIWARLTQPGEDPLDVGERRYAREDSVFSYKNCVVAELDGDVIGMLVAFPMDSEPNPGKGGEEDPVLEPYSKLEAPGSHYICGMAVFPEHRGCGLGTEMLAIAREQARQRGLGELSLVVFEQNTGAKRLYDRHRFREVGRQPVVPHELIRYTGDALLMVADVD